MATSSSELAQSRFYSPAFNSAIFDGPFRIYFAPFQENEALKVYFKIHNHFKAILENTSSHINKYDRQIFILLYPTLDCLLKAFDSEEDRVYHTRIDDYHGFGLLSSSAEKLMSKLLDQLDESQFSNITPITTTIPSKLCELK